MAEKLKVASVLVLIFGAYGLMGTLEFEDEQREIEHYCEMRRIWEDGKDIDPRFRPGWPNFKPEVNCK